MSSASGVALVVGAYAHGDPVVLARAPVDVLHRRRVPAIAAPLHDRPENLEFHCLHGGHVEHGFDHRHLDELATARTVGELQRGESGERRMCAREWIARTARGDRGSLGQSGHPCQAGDLLHRRREADPVPPWARQSECGHPDHDNPGVEFEQRVGAEPELLHHPGEKFSMTTSASLISSLTSRRPSPDCMSRVIDRLLVFIAWNNQPYSHQSSTSVRIPPE